MRWGREEVSALLAPHGDIARLTLIPRSTGSFPWCRFALATFATPAAAVAAAAAPPEAGMCVSTKRRRPAAGGDGRTAPPQRKERKAGDWDCAACGTHNFARRDECFKSRLARDRLRDDNSPHTLFKTHLLLAQLVVAACAPPPAVAEWAAAHALLVDPTTELGDDD
eukprot:gene41177-10052_t